MHPKRKKKLIGIILGVFILSIVVGLVLYALRQNINLFYTPSQLQAVTMDPHQVIRVGGMVQRGSVHHNTRHLEVTFILRDMQSSIQVSYDGLLPDLFREGQGIVAIGYLRDPQHFVATSVLAKHDEKYMPPLITASIHKGTLSHDS